MKKLLLIMLIAFVGILIFCGCSSPDLDDVFTKLNNAKTMEIEMVMRQVQPKESRELMSMYVIANGKGKEKYTYTKAVVEENTKEVYVVDNNIFTCLNTVLQSAEQQESTMFNTEQDKMVELFSLDFEEMQYSITTEKLDKDRTNYIYQFSKNDLASMFGNFLGSSYFESCKMNLIVKDRTKLPESMYIEFVYNANNKITCDIIYKNINKTIKKSLPKVLKSINPKEFGIEYDLLNENEYQVSRYTNTNNTVVIPSTYNGLPVTSIGNNAFAYKETLKYVTLPESITSIGNYCFASGSFYSIRRITLSKNLTYIGKYAFSNSNSEIIFPNGSVIEEISPFAFYEYKGNGISLPSSIKVLGNNAFTYSQISSINLPHNLTEIKYSAFEDCQNLESIIIPAGVTILDSSVFEDCTRLNEVNILGDITEISSRAFSQCYCLKRINSETDGVFNLNFSLVKIEDEAFRCCDAMEEVNIAETVTQIGSEVFSQCLTLAAIHVDEDNTEYKSIDGVLYDKSGETLLYYPVGKPQITFILPEGIKVLSSFAFYGVHYLENIVITEGVTTIDDCAICCCYSLKSIIIPSTVNVINQISFDECEQLEEVFIYAITPPQLMSFFGEFGNYKIYVPAESVDIYLENEMWQYYYYDRICAIPEE